MTPRPIPYYKQTAGFSCGAACLVMALHALKATPVTRSFEFEVWREATMIGVRGIDQWGLTIPALRRGIPATVISDAETTFPAASETARARFTEEDLEISRFVQGDNRARADALGATWYRREPAPDDVRQALAADRVPVLLVDLMILAGDYAAPHWVVASSIRGHDVVIHDPDADDAKPRTISLDEAWRSTNVSRYLARPAMVVFG